MAETLVRDYCTDCVRAEWRRLVRDPYHGLEFRTSLHYLEKHLPRKGRILDAGGGLGCRIVFDCFEPTSTIARQWMWQACIPVRLLPMSIRFTPPAR